MERFGEMVAFHGEAVALTSENLNVSARSVDPAELLADGTIRGVGFTQRTQANGVFATLPAGVADRLRPSFRFYDWDAARSEVRWMCSFDTTEADVDAFVAAIARETSAA